MAEGLRGGGDADGGGGPAGGGGGGGRGFWQAGHSQENSPGYACLLGRPEQRPWIQERQPLHQ